MSFSFETTELDNLLLENTELKLKINNLIFYEIDCCKMQISNLEKQNTELILQLNTYKTKLNTLEKEINQLKLQSIAK
jgi:hypothetical protein